MKINYKRIFVACLLLGMLLCISAVSASDINETDELTVDSDAESISIEEECEVASVDAEEILQESGNSTAVVSAHAKTSSAGIYVKNSKFDIQILDDKGNGIANKSVQVSFNKKISNLTTDSNGHVYYKLTGKGVYTLKYTFKQDGYTKVTGSKSVTVVDSSKSKITASNYVAYVGIKNPYTVTLSVGGVKIANKKITFKIKGKTYTKTTNSKGEATLNINLPKGKYTIKYSFKGQSNAKSASGSKKITVKKGCPTTLTWQNAVIFKHKTSTPFILKYRNAHGNIIPYKTIVLKINGKTYTKKTDKNGLVTFYIKQKAGVYRCTVNSYNTDVLKSVTNIYNIAVKSDGKMNGGFWLFGADMNKVDLSKMAKYGTKHIFLNYYAIELHGKTAVSKFATEAKSLGIKVHIWMQIFNNGNWISPVNKDGSYKYSLFNSIIKEAKGYAAIKGVAGIHFDYLRFPGTAYKYKNAANAVTYFTKTACKALHKQNSNLIVSAAIMPEVSALKYYYGQDVSALSKYLDVIVPMIYKGNYHQSSSWIRSVTSSLVSQSNGAQIWSGLQGYASDSNVVKLSASALKNDAKSAVQGGANGIIVFRYSLFNFIDFKQFAN